MEFFLLLYIVLIYINNINNYVLIPFDISIENQKNNIDLNNDILSLKFLEEPYINLTIGDPQQTIKMRLTLNQHEIIIRDSEYNYTLSNSFKINKIYDGKYVCNETFNLFTINSSKELNEYIHKDNNNRKIIQQNNYKEYNNVKFIHLNMTEHNYLEKEMEQKEIDKLLLSNYGMLGLRLNKKNDDMSPQLIKSLRQIKSINDSIFTFYFNKGNNDDHYGYLIIGDKFTDTEKEFEETNSTLFGMRDVSLSWDLRTDTIYSKAKDNSKDISLFLEKNIVVELLIEESYFLGDEKYKSFIDTIFFNDLVEKKVCTYKRMSIDTSFGTYVCDSKSKIFLDYYNNIFPNLVFHNEKIGDEFILTKKDLFFYNDYNKSDTNIYFIIYFSYIYTKKWMLGRPFLEKYRLSFNIDASEIMYHKKKYIDDDEEIVDVNNNNNENYEKDNTIIKVIVIIVLVIIIFFLGFFLHKLITKIPRKKKANELDDDFDYTEKNDKDKKLCNDDLVINNNDN